MFMNAFHIYFFALYPSQYGRDQSLRLELGNERQWSLSVKTESQDSLSSIVCLLPHVYQLLVVASHFT